MTFQISLAAEVRVGERLFTLSTGWGFGTFASMFGLIYQGAVGIRRYGAILAGFFLTGQYANVQEIQRGQQKPSAYGQKLRGGASRLPLGQ